MSALYKHKHHIVPKHAGGSDDPSNFIELTIEEHAEAHRILFEEFGRWQDRLAWQTLSGQITNAEANIQATKLANTGSGNARYGKPGTLLVAKEKIIQLSVRKLSIENHHHVQKKQNRKFESH